MRCQAIKEGQIMYCLIEHSHTVGYRNRDETSQLGTGVINVAIVPVEVVGCGRDGIGDGKQHEQGEQRRSSPPPHGGVLSAAVKETGPVS